MTLEDALRLREGDIVTHKHTAVSRRPIRVTEVWINERKTIVMVRLASVAGAAWLDATGYDHPPSKTDWCKTCVAWETASEAAERHPTALAERNPKHGTLATKVVR